MWELPNLARRLALLAAVSIGRRLLASAIEFDGSSYARTASLDADLDIFWTIDDEAETIRVAVHAKAATGWVGFGISEMGGMEGADIVFYEAEVSTCNNALCEQLPFVACIACACKSKTRNRIWSCLM